MNANLKNHTLKQLLEELNNIKCSCPLMSSGGCFDCQNTQYCASPEYVDELKDRIELEEFKLEVDSISTEKHGIDITSEYNEEDLIFYGETYNFKAISFVEYYAKKYDLI